MNKNIRKVLGMTQRDFYLFQVASSLYQRTWNETEQAKMVIEKIDFSAEEAKKELKEGEEYEMPQELADKKDELQHVVASNERQMPKYKKVIQQLINKYFD